MDKTNNIFYIVEDGKLEAYYRHIDEFDVNIVNSSGFTLLHKAIAWNQPEIASDLITRSIDVNIQDKRGQTSLHYLGWYPNLELAKKIIKNGGNLEISDKYGNTPLWYAVFYAKGNYSLVSLFMTHNANPNSKNRAGMTPLAFALKINDMEMVRILTGSSELG